MKVNEGTPNEGVLNECSLKLVTPMNFLIMNILLIYVLLWRYSYECSRNDGTSMKKRQVKVILMKVLQRKVVLN